MEVHPRLNSVMPKRLWNVLRVSFFMIRKGLVSKRKLIMDMNLMMKRGKLLRKSLGDLLHLHHHPRNMARGSYGLREYEFSCSSSPNPVFFHVPKRKHHYFPCINLPEVIEEEEEEEEDDANKAALVMLAKTPEYTFNLFHQLDASDFAPGENRSPLPSPFSIRVSDYSSEDDNENGINGQVDDEAEEFIKRFYEQLRLQSRTQFLEYQDRN